MSYKQNEDPFRIDIQSIEDPIERAKVRKRRHQRILENNKQCELARKNGCNDNGYRYDNYKDYEKEHRVYVNIDDPNYHQKLRVKKEKKKKKWEQQQLQNVHSAYSQRQFSEDKEAKEQQEIRLRNEIEKQRKKKKLMGQLADVMSDIQGLMVSDLIKPPPSLFQQQTAMLNKIQQTNAQAQCFDYSGGPQYDKGGPHYRSSDIDREMQKCLGATVGLHKLEEKAAEIYEMFPQNDNVYEEAQLRAAQHRMNAAVVRQDVIDAHDVGLVSSYNGNKNWDGAVDYQLDHAFAARSNALDNSIYKYTQCPRCKEMVVDGVCDC
eukprot:237807_1